MSADFIENTLTNKHGAYTVLKLDESELIEKKKTFSGSEPPDLKTNGYQELTSTSVWSMDGIGLGDEDPKLYIPASCTAVELYVVIKGGVAALQETDDDGALVNAAATTDPAVGDALVKKILGTDDKSKLKEELQRRGLVYAIAV